jgi:FkbM family methyltransferase
MIKQFIKKILIVLRIDLTKNIHYDRLTLNILDKVLKQDSNCIDIGCHKGEILEEILKRAPLGKHKAFEPIPFFYRQLKENFTTKNVEVFDVALSNSTGETTFNYVVDAPAYSGIKKRDYKIKEPNIEKLSVKLETLDHLLPKDYQLDFIKLDVEGAEFNVLKGAEKTLIKYNPTIIFEFGLGASDHYNVNPSEFFDFLVTTCNYKIFLLDAFLKRKSALTEEKFLEVYNNNKEYYFIASPK